MRIIKLFVLLMVSTMAVQADKVAPPNVVLILSDDQGYADYSFMGHDLIETPRIDKLASESLVYKRGYVTTGVCSPSISTMLTGLYPHQHGTTGNDPLLGTQRAPWIEHFRNHPQLPALLAEKGYLSLHTGKYWHADPLLGGFTHGMGKTGRHGSEYSLSIGRETMQPIYDFIRTAQEESKPFMIWYAPFMPHTPHTPPERLEKKYLDLGAGGQSKYYAMCEWFDETCGQLLDHLDDNGLSDNTVIFYICDNGWGSLGKGSVKASPYELGVRTPIMIKWPEHVKAQVDEHNLTSNLDLVPTVLAACGVDIPETMEGVNLLDYQAVAQRKSLFLENFTHDMLDVKQPEAALRARSYVDRNWKLTVWQEPHASLDIKGWQMNAPDVKVQLFNLVNDPMERVNLASEYPERVSKLKSKLDAWWGPES